MRIHSSVASTQNDEYVVFYPYAHQYGGIERNIIALSSYIHRISRTRLRLVTFHCSVLELLECSDLVVDHVTLDSSNYILRVIGLRLKLSSLSLTRPVFAFGQKAGFFLYLAGCKNYLFHFTDPPSLLTPPKSKVNPIRSFVADHIQRRSVRNAAGLVTMTKANASELENLYGKKFSVVYQGGCPTPVTSHAASCPLLNDLNSTFRLLSVCRLQKSKHLDWALHASAALADSLSFRNISVELHIVGDGSELHPLSRLSETLVHARQNLTILFHGFVHCDELEKLYSVSALVLVPAKQGYGLPVLEAAYRFIPVVLSSESRISEILSNDPFFSISQHSQVAFTEAVLKHASNFIQGTLPSQPTCHLPTEDSWASQILNLWKAY